MPIAITEEQLAIQASIREWAKRTRAIEVVRGLEPADPSDAPSTGDTRAATAPQGGPDSAAAERWSSLAGLGLFSIGLPAEAAEASGSTADLAAALAQVTESLVPGPVMPTLLAALVLARCQTAMARRMLASIAAGQISVAVAFEPETVRAVRRDDGTLTLSGAAGLVLGGGSTTHLLVGAAAELGTQIDSSRPGSTGPETAGPETAGPAAADKARRARAPVPGSCSLPIILVSPWWIGLPLTSPARWRR